MDKHPISALKRYPMKSLTQLSSCLRRSQEKLDRMDLASVFQDLFPGYESHRKASEPEDRAGSDYFLTVAGRSETVDIKLLSRDPHLYGFWKLGPALPLELWSVKERWICGYGGNADYVLWLYEDSTRTVLVRREDLVAFVNERRLEWMFFLKENESLSQLPNGTVYTSSFSWIPFYVLDKYQIFKHNQAA